MELEGIAAVLSLLLSSGLAVCYLRDRRAAKFGLTTEYSTALLEWHAKVVELLVTARCLDLPRDSDDHKRDLARLSALIEQGRFMFPNIKKGNVLGQDKPSAYQGYRNITLDFLVASHNLLQDQASHENRAKLELLQKHFTSVVYDIVRPWDRLKTIRSLTNTYFVKEQSIEDFLRQGDGSVINHIWENPEIRIRKRLEKETRPA